MRIIGKFAVAATVAGGMLLVAPAANADVNVNVGGLVGASADGVISADLLGAPILTINNPLNSLLPNGILGG